MALYATLRAEVTCPRCSRACERTWQFHFGSVSNFPEYGLGDRITWDQGTRLGDPSIEGDVTVVGHCVEDVTCESCRLEGGTARIHVHGGVIERLELGPHEEDEGVLFRVGAEGVPHGWTANGRRVAPLRADGSEPDAEARD